MANERSTLPLSLGSHLSWEPLCNTQTRTVCTYFQLSLISQLVLWGQLWMCCK